MFFCVYFLYVISQTCVLMQFHRFPQACRFIKWSSMTADGLFLLWVDHLTMDYLDNFDNGFLINITEILKIKKKS
jgi:hypothetical protein